MKLKYIFLFGFFSIISQEVEQGVNVAELMRDCENRRKPFIAKKIEKVIKDTTNLPRVLGELIGQYTNGFFELELKPALEDIGHFKLCLPNGKILFTKIESHFKIMTFSLWDSNTSEISQLKLPFCFKYMVISPYVTDGQIFVAGIREDKWLIYTIDTELKDLVLLHEMSLDPVSYDEVIFHPSNNWVIFGKKYMWAIQKKSLYGFYYIDGWLNFLPNGLSLRLIKEGDNTILQIVSIDLQNFASKKLTVEKSIKLPIKEAIWDIVFSPDYKSFVVNCGKKNFLFKLNESEEYSLSCEIPGHSPKFISNDLISSSGDLSSSGIYDLQGNRLSAVPCAIICYNGCFLSKNGCGDYFFNQFMVD